MSDSKLITLTTALPITEVPADAFDERALGVRPLSMDYLDPAQSVPLDLFLPRLEKQGATVVMGRILQAGQAPTEHQLGVIRRTGFSQVYFKESEVALVLDYLAARARVLVADPGVPLGRKAGLLHDTARHIVEQTLLERELTPCLDRGREYVTQLIGFLSGDRAAVQSLAEALATDYDLYTHSVNVGLLTVAFADFLHLSRDEIRALGLGALVHDIGKRDLDPELVLKRGRLTDEERRIMRRHPLTGFDLLSQVPALAWPVLRIVRHHHENLDGSGYPDGLKHDQLETGLRIVRIVDAYDTLTAALQKGEKGLGMKAIQLMIKHMPGQIAPDLLRAFVEFLGYAAPGREADPARDRTR